MRSIRTLLITLALVGVAACAALAQVNNSGQDVFLDVVVQERFFRSGATWPSLSIRTREAVRLDCLVYDGANRLVAHKAADARTNQFSIILDHLPRVSRGLYLFSLVASDPEEKCVGIYPKVRGGGEIIQVKDSEIDPEKRTIAYSLPRAACVRLRAGFREGLYLQPIISGEAQPAGRHTVAWDGSGQAGLFTNLYQHSAVHVSILAVTLPVNILVAQGSSTLSTNYPQPDLQPLPSHLVDLASPSWLNSGREKPDVLIADDYTLVLETHEDSSARTVEIRTDCISANRSRLFNKRFELMLFLDTTFLAEDEHSQLPFSYRMSIRGLAPGRHIFTANVVDSDSSLGTVSKEFVVIKP